MKKLSAFLIASLLALASSNSFAQGGARVGDFALLDQDGIFHQLSRYSNNDTVVVIAASENAEKTVDSLEELYGDSTQYFLISVDDDVAYFDSEVPVLLDPTEIVSKALGLETEGSAVAIDPNTFEIIERVSSAGDSILYTDVTNISYTVDVAPVIAENCATCHREGGIAPFAMNSSAMVQGWAPMIREVLMTKAMPPGQLDPKHINEFSNSRVLDPIDIQNIVQWVNEGAIVGLDNELLESLTWPESQWAFGEPDLILDIQATTVPATGQGVFVDVDVVFDMPTDRWVKASQILPGERTVLHHTVNSLSWPEEIGEGISLGALGGTGAPSDKANLAAYVPGMTPSLNPENTGGLLKAGSVLSLNMHYTPNGRETTDASQIGVWFYPEGEVPEERMIGQCACVFPFTWTTIPANDPAFQQSAQIVISEDANIHSFLPHMHFRGKAMTFTAEYPDGTFEELINIAAYNYNWQITYAYAEPKFVPAGTVVTALATWDNSAQNPSNPNPDRNVDWGNQSWDEMFFGVVTWKNLEQ
jgi:hypothetical protein